MTEPVSGTYKLDLDALERDLAKPWTHITICHDELATLVRIARAAVAWRNDNDKTWTPMTDLIDALRKAGL